MSARKPAKGLVQRLVGGPTPPPDPSTLPVWMDPVELSQLRAIVEAIAPRHVLEWGAGGSTRELLESCPFIESYLSIEHNRAWFELVRARVTDARLDLRYVAPGEPEPEPLASGTSAAKKARKEAIVAWHRRAEREPELMRDYVAEAATAARPFDFILVDGRARSFCIRAGASLLRPGGVLVVHDAQRPDYHEALHAIGRPVFFSPWHQGQICLVRPGGAT